MKAALHKTAARAVNLNERFLWIMFFVGEDAPVWPALPSNRHA